MPLEVPVASLNAKSSQTVSLEGTVYRFTFIFNTRCASWSMTIAEQDGTVILSEIKILPQVNLLFRHKDERLPPGQLWALDVQDGEDALRPEKSQFGSKLKLIYFTEDEINAIISS